MEKIKNEKELLEYLKNNYGLELLEDSTFRTVETEIASIEDFYEEDEKECGDCNYLADDLKPYIGKNYLVNMFSKEYECFYVICNKDFEFIELLGI